VARMLEARGDAGSPI